MLDTRTDLEKSDIFWDLISSGAGPDEIVSMKAGIQEADVVVVGRITALHPGEHVAGYAVTRATLTLDEILKGEPQTPVIGTVTLQLPPVEEPWLAEETMPAHRNLLFLFYVPAFLERLGQPEKEQAEELYDYILMNGSQAVIREIAGMARDILIPPDERFPAEFEGQPFDEVVARARRLAERSR